jgi:hypothetical protein
MGSVYRPGRELVARAIRHTDANHKVPGLQGETAQGNVARLASAELSIWSEALATKEARKTAMT